MPNRRNILIFALIATLVGTVYFHFFSGDEEVVPDLVSSPSVETTTLPGAIPNPALGQDFLSLLLNVKNIKLDDSVFAEPAFKSLVDSSITLVQDQKEGRPNPFAPLGVETSTTGSSAMITITPEQGL